MGIQSFLRRMQDAGYGSSPTEIVRRGTSSHKAILDGPNLAFHIARLLLDQWHCADAAIWVPVTYAQIVSSVVEFLQMLEGYGFEISAVFFDGVLPFGKIDVRISRLQRYVDALSSYHALHCEASKLARGGRIDASKTWNSPSLQRARRALPGLPFLVPAIVEGLLRSTYAGVTYLVPGEADAFCVALARRACEANSDEKVVIFSNDSDLLIYNCGQRSRIVMFSGLSAMNGRSASDQLMGTEFWPAAIARMAGKEDLIEIAYHMQKDNTVTVHWVLQLMKQGDYVAGRDFEDFEQTYRVDHEIRDLDQLQGDVEAHFTLAHLDARVSELIHQFRFLSEEHSSQEINVFLPFLLEDPTKRTAWYIGRRTRLAAYDLLRSAYESSLTILNEYRRSGASISMQAISRAEINYQATELWLSQLNTRTHDVRMSLRQSKLSTTQKWRFIVMQLALFDMVHEEIMIPSAQDIAAVLGGQNNKVWTSFHLSAQYQAAYYSLRMLEQIWRYLRNVTVPRSELQRRQDVEIKARMQDLDNLPGISEFFEPDADNTIAVTWLSLVEPLVKSLKPELTAQDRVKTAASKKAKKRKKNEDHEDVGTKWKRQVSSNPFAALGNMS